MATPATLLPDPAFLHLARLEAFPQNITAIVTTISSEACCPSCQCSSEKVHSRYVRLVADLPYPQLFLFERRVPSSDFY